MYHYFSCLILYSHVNICCYHLLQTIQTVQRNTRNMLQREHSPCIFITQSLATVFSSGIMFQMIVLLTGRILSFPMIGRTILNLPVLYQRRHSNGSLLMLLTHHCFVPTYCRWPKMMIWKPLCSLKQILKPPQRPQFPTLLSHLHVSITIIPPNFSTQEIKNGQWHC